MFHVCAETPASGRRPPGRTPLAYPLAWQSNSCDRSTAIPDPSVFDICILPTCRIVDYRITSDRRNRLILSWYIPSLTIPKTTSTRSPLWVGRVTPLSLFPFATAEQQESTVCRTVGHLHQGISRLNQVDLPWVRTIAAATTTPIADNLDQIENNTASNSVTPCCARHLSKTCPDMPR